MDKFCEGMDMDHHDDHHDDMHRNLGGHDEKDDHDMDHHGMDHGMDHDSNDHRHVKDMYLCMQAKQMHWDLTEYLYSDDDHKKRMTKDWRKDIKEMKEDWGYGGASNLAMAGAAMIVAVSALTF